ncbi:MocR-like pyridoxine biosynthesis transcription factor PdxR [Psychroserpens sp. MEBiC05023]
MHFNIKNILITNGFDLINNTNNIYFNLYESLKKAIIKRYLEENFKLPPTRVLSKDLNVSRSTVIKAYDILVLEKFIKSKPGSGYYVASLKNKKFNHNLNANQTEGNYPKISKRGLAFKKNIQLITNRPKGIAFRPGLPPLDIFPVQQWKNLSNDYWKTVKASELSYSNTLGLECLRESISNYLKIYRNIDCNPNQIIITTGSLHSLSLISNSLIDKNDNVVIENPTYPHAYNLFHSLKAKIHTSKIDNEGIIIKDVKCVNPKLIYTTPSNQYPTGIKMSLKRRSELLKWASANNSLIIEDDYDHEFSNWEKPLSSMFSLDRQERVVYLGTFNKLMHPSIRLGYMILPDFLIDTVRALYEQSSRFVSPSQQKILNDFIEKDYLNKHLRKVIQVSIQRKSLFLKHFNDAFENDIIINSENSGLHIIGNLKANIEDVKLSDLLSQKGIIAHPFSNYFVNGKKENGLVMGYCSVNHKVIKETIIKMKAGYSNYLK